MCSSDIALLKNLTHHTVLLLNIWEIYLYQMLYTKYISPSSQKKETEKGTIELDKVIKRWVPLKCTWNVKPL